MTLHVDMDLVMRFAGKCGAEEAHHAYQLLRTWRATKQGRAATFHAAQVIRAAKYTRPYELRGAEAFLTFDAIMVLWTYSIMLVDSAKQSRSTTPAPGRMMAQRKPEDASEQLVFLDEPNSETTEAYMMIGTGRPCLSMQKVADEMSSAGQDSAGGAVCDLRSPLLVMQMGVQVLQGNCPSDGPEDIPQMLRSLCEVMDGLGRLK